MYNTVTWLHLVKRRIGNAKHYHVGCKTPCRRDLRRSSAGEDYLLAWQLRTVESLVLVDVHDDSVRRWWKPTAGKGGRKQKLSIAHLIVLSGLIPGALQ
eukprot:1967353-Amphidinium_carterae.1